MLKIQVLDKEKQGNWRSLVESYPNSTLFHTPEWLNFLEKTFGAEKLLTGIYEGNKIVGIFPMLLYRKGPFKIMGSPLRGWMTAYMGPLVDVSLLEETMMAFNSFLETIKVDYVEVCFRQPRLSLSSLRGYTCEQPETFILTLENDIEKAWRKLKDKCRKKVRKAERSEVVVTEAQNRECVEEVYRMLEETFKRRNRLPSKTKQFYYDMWDFLKPTGRMKVLIAEHKDRPVACRLFGFYKDTIYSLTSASYSEYLNLAPNNLLHWWVIKWGVENGFKEYDMYGKGGSEVGIDLFKASFGANGTTYTRYSRAASPIARAGTALYQRWLSLEPRLRYHLHR